MERQLFDSNDDNDFIWFEISMERQLFDWESLDDLGDSDYVFNYITLTQPIEGYPIGTKFHSALLSFSDGLLYLQDKTGENIVHIELKLVVK